MDANTVFTVFLALSPEEKERFTVLMKEQKKSYDFKKSKKDTFKFTKEDAVEYLLGAVFMTKYQNNNK
uniref:hypothetical protein n=1 Tax=Flavobacterium sp. TaxID=239 RepID=UPI00404997E2